MCLLFNTILWRHKSSDTPSLWLRTLLQYSKQHRLPFTLVGFVALLVLAVAISLNIQIYVGLDLKITQLKNCDVIILWLCAIFICVPIFTISCGLENSLRHRHRYRNRWTQDISCEAPSFVIIIVLAGIKFFSFIF